MPVLWLEPTSSCSTVPCSVNRATVTLHEKNVLFKRLRSKMRKWTWNDYQILPQTSTGRSSCSNPVFFILGAKVLQLVGEINSGPIKRFRCLLCDQNFKQKSHVITHLVSVPLSKYFSGPYNKTCYDRKDYDASSRISCIADYGASVVIYDGISMITTS